MTRALPLLSLVSLLPLLFPSLACTSVARQEHLDEKEERWHTIEVDAPSDDVVWQLTLLALRSQDFPLAAGTDPGARQVESGWKTDMQPFEGEGERRRAIVKLAPLAPGRWQLSARVRVERNDNLVTPLDRTRAEWKRAADDEKASVLLLQHVRARLQPELRFEPAAAKASS